MYSNWRAIASHYPRRSIGVDDAAIPSTRTRSTRVPSRSSECRGSGSVSSAPGKNVEGTRPVRDEYATRRNLYSRTVPSNEKTTKPLRNERKQRKYVVRLERTRIKKREQYRLLYFIKRKRLPSCHIWGMPSIKIIRFRD